MSYFYHHELIRISYEPFYSQLFRGNIHLRYKLKATENKLINKRKVNPSLYLGEYIRIVKNEKTGLTNIDGEMILPCIYNQILRDKDLFLVQKDSLWEVLTSNMKLIFLEKIQKVDILSNHYFRLKKKGKWGVKTIDDKEIIPFEYDVVWEKFGLFILKQNDKWGIVDQKGNLVKPFEYDRIPYIKEGYFVLYQKDKQGVMGSC